MYCTSQRFREYTQENFPNYVSWLVKEDNDEYEINVDDAMGALSYDLSVKDFLAMGLSSEDAVNIVCEKFQEFVDIELTMWLKWSYNKYQSDKQPVHLLRYIILQSLM